MKDIRTPQCPLCHKGGDIQVSNTSYDNWKSGVTIQKALPELSSEIREQIISGTHPECWTILFGDYKDDE